MKEPVRNPGLRVSLTVVLALAGFVFPLAFAAAALIGWSLYEDFKNPRDIVDDWTTRRWTTTEADPEWRTYFHKFCDSPAETAFMDAMIASYDLKPSKGVLVGNGIELNLQVKMKPYRADFIVNKLWVVEIDGATYHSSPEAVAYDKARDEFMTEKGYRVLRIPASVVFADPEEAVARVASFLNPKPVNPPTAAVLTSIVNSLGSKTAQEGRKLFEQMSAKQKEEFWKALAEELRDKDPAEPSGNSYSRQAKSDLGRLDAADLPYRL